MKSHFFLLPLLALAPVAASAQIKPTTAPPISVAPAAKILLDQATATYQGAKGIRFHLSVNENKIQRDNVVSFQKPNLLRVETSSASNSGRPSLVVFDGKSRFSVQGKTFGRQPVPAQIPVSESLGTVLNSGTGYLIVAMMEGRSPVVEIQNLLARNPKDVRMVVTLANPALIGGDVLRGVKIQLLPRAAKAGQGEASDIGLWFGADGLLRRVSTHDVTSGRTFISVEQISEQQLDPAFAPDTFKFNATGLQPDGRDTPPNKPAIAQPPAPDEDIYWDPRLKVGTQPFDFSANALDGTAITPAQYKGKVLLMDFWATWCGPCVASLPELQATYKKYHAQGLEVVGVSLDRQQSDLTTFIAARKMAWPQVFNPAQKTSVAKTYGVKAIPFFLIIGRNGKIAAVNPRDDLEGAVKKALAAS